MKKLTIMFIFLSIASCLFAQKNIHTFKNVESNIMINKDGSYNAYLFIDTLHFENEGVILSRHDGHMYLISDGSEISKIKNIKKIIGKDDVYIYEPAKE